MQISFDNINTNFGNGPIQNFSSVTINGYDFWTIKYQKIAQITLESCQTTLNRPSEQLLFNHVADFVLPANFS